MRPDYRSLCAGLVGHLERSDWPPKYRAEIALALEAAHEALAQSHHPQLFVVNGDGSELWMRCPSCASVWKTSSPSPHE